MRRLGADGGWSSESSLGLEGNSEHHASAEQVRSSDFND